jgi:peptidoglycan hydrolase CwlO-like protein
MKITKAFVLFAIIALSTQLTVNRVETKNVRSKKTANKALTVLKQGTPCSTAVYDVYIIVDGNETAKISANFDARELKLPAGESQRGWKFNAAVSTNVNDFVGKILYKAEGNFYFLPYRTISIPFGVDVPAGAPKSIIATIQSTATESHSIQIRFNYDPNWDIIEDNVLTRVVTWANVNRNSRLEYIKDLKVKTLAAMQDYTINQNTANLAGADATAITNQITKLNGDIATLNKNTEKSQLDLDNNSLLITQQKSKIDGLKTTKKGYDTTLDQLSGTKTSYEGSIKKYKSDQDNNTADQNSYKSLSDGALQKIDGLFAIYKDECANQSTNIETARSELIGNKGCTSFNSYISKALATK